MLLSRCLYSSKHCAARYVLNDIVFGLVVLLAVVANREKALWATFLALLYRKHLVLYCRKIQAAPPWHYYCGVFAAAAPGSALGGDWRLACGATCLWMVMTIPRHCLLPTAYLPIYGG